MKDLLSCNESKEAVVIIFFALHLIKCKTGSQITYVATSEGGCLASNGLTIQHLRSEQEDADIRVLLHALDATKRGCSSLLIHRCTRATTMDLQETLSRNVLDKCWPRRSLRGSRGGYRESVAWLSRFLGMRLID
jgi:hypothetical protein